MASFMICFLYFYFSITVEYFKQLSRKQKNNLLQMYKLDFELFGYDWRKYFKEDRSEK